MSYIDIGILCLIVVFVIIGFFKGFKLKRISFFLFILSIFIGFIVSVPLARLIMDTSVGNGWLAGIYENSIGDQGALGVQLGGTYDEQQLLLQNGLTQLKFPVFIQGLFIDQVLESSFNVQRALASSFAYLTLIAFFFLLIFIVVMILLYSLVKPIWKSIFGENGKGVFGRISGMLIGLMKASIIIILLLTVINLIDILMVSFNNNVLHDFLIKNLYLESSKFSIGKLYYFATSWILNWIKLI